MRKLVYLFILFTAIINAQIVNIPDANFKAKLISLGVDSNSDGEIQESEALAITILDIGGDSSITDISGIQSFANLQVLYCSNTSVENLDFSSLTLLEELYVENNNSLAAINIIGCSNLISLDCRFNNSLTALNLSGLSNLQYMSCSGNSITAINYTGCSNLSYFYCDGNQLTGNLNLSGLTNLTELNCQENQLSSIDVSGCELLSTFVADSNPTLISLNASGCTSLAGQLNCYPHGNLNISNCPLLQNVSVYECQNINLTGCISLTLLDITDSSFLSLDLSNLSDLIALSLINTTFNTINFSGCVNLNNLQIAYYSNLANLDLSSLVGLETVNIYADTLPLSLDFSNNLNLLSVSISGNGLETLFLKNGKNETVSFDGVSSLQFICADDAQVTSIQNQLNTLGMLTIVCNSYCTFAPGGNYNTITGSMIYDANVNGCDASDIPQPNIRIDINDGTNQGATSTNSAGNYNFYTQAGSFALTPNIENPTWFTFSPSSANTVFANNNNNTQIQNFCIAANGVHNDVEVVIAPISQARPGFDAVYEIVFKNKGNQILSGSVDFTYNDSILDFVSSTITPSGQSSGLLTWNYTNLLPFENRSFYFTLNVNLPTEIPAVNIGDILNFSTSISPVVADENPLDNTSNYNQIVVGSFDPNFKECIEGETVSTTLIGDYLHYAINFENTGNYQAENVVVKDVIDTTKFDISTLQVLNSSYPVTVRVFGNIAEFRFHQIYLDTGGHGTILVKIKTLPTLTEGTQVTNIANIFFDYNSPIETNEARTTFETLSNSSFTIDTSISIAPNPVENSVNVSCNNNIKTIELFDVQGRLLQTQLLDSVESVLNISDKTNGIYFIKITSEKGSKVEKLVKK